MALVSGGVPRKGELNPGGVEETSYTGRGMIRVISKNDRDESLKDIVERVRPYVENIQGAIIRFSTEDPIENLMFGGGKPLRDDLYGDDMEAERRYAGPGGWAVRATDAATAGHYRRSGGRQGERGTVRRRGRGQGGGGHGAGGGRAGPAMERADGSAGGRGSRPPPLRRSSRRARCSPASAPWRDSRAGRRCPCCEPR